MLMVTLYNDRGEHFGYYLGLPKEYDPEKEKVYEFDCLSTQDCIAGYQIINEWNQVLYRHELKEGEFTATKCARKGNKLIPQPGAKLRLKVPSNLVKVGK